MKNYILAVVLGTLALFVWNALSWMVIGIHDRSYDNIPEEVMQQVDFKKMMPQGGVYHYPGLPEGGGQEAWAAMSRQMEEGPVVSLMVYLPEGREPFSTSDFILSLFFNLVSVSIAIFLLSQTNLTVYGAKALFVTLLGVFAAFAVELPTGSWYGFPANYILPNLMDHIVGFGLVGAIAGWFVNKKAG